MEEPIEGAGELHYLPRFASQLLGNERTLAVWLPPGYGASSARYPVLYLQDGQNLFDPSASAFGVTWNAGRTASRLILAGRVQPFLLVGIYNTSDRLDEYALHFDPRIKRGGRGSLYGRFLFEEVKPAIDARYRTRPERDCTAVAGSSMGGLISLALARERQADFALCGALSPSLWWAGGELLRQFEVDHAWMRSMRFWVDMGTRESQRRRGIPPELQRTRELLAIFDNAGLIPGRHYYYQEVVGGEHNEAHWGGRLDRVLLFFFGK